MFAHDTRRLTIPARGDPTRAPLARQGGNRAPPIAPREPPRWHAVHMTSDGSSRGTPSETTLGDPLTAEDGELVDATPASPTEVAFVEQTVLRRTRLLDEMPAEQLEGVVEVTLAMIQNRFAQMQRIVDVSSTHVNINPFLMLAMAPAYNIFSPFEAAEYTQNSKMPHGDATAFGKYVEAKIFPLFGVTEPPEKKADPALYSPIDAEISVEGIRYLTTWKSGPWTMNQAHANEMIRSFPKIHEQSGNDIVLGIFYGKRKRLNNKPALVARQTGVYFHVMVGKDLWEFVTGVRDAHLSILRAIREAQARFALEHGGKTFYEHMIEARLKLAQSFREEFDLVGADEDMWEMIFRKSF